MNKTIMMVLTLLSLSLTACAGDTSYPAPPPYTNPAGNKFPILGYQSFAVPEMCTAKNYQYFKDAGFTLALPASRDTSHNFAPVLNLCNEMGIKCFVSANLATAERRQQFLSKYDTYPAFAGLVLKDEPSMKLFADLAKETKEVQQQTSGRVDGYINLFPNYATPAQLGAKDYEEYVSNYVKEVNPRFISFDNYGIMKIRGQLILRGDYYQNLEIVSRIARESGRPMWSFVLSTPHFDYPMPTEAQIRLQAFSGLAYGSQGLQYFGYAIRSDHPELFGTPPVLLNGKRTAVWYMMRTVNREVQALAPVFLGMKLLGVWHTGVRVPLGTQRLQISDLPGPVERIDSDGEGLVVSRFTNNGKEYMLLLNRDFQNSQHVVVDFGGKLTRINEKGKASLTGKQNYNLKPAAWLLFEI